MKKNNEKIELNEKDFEFICPVKSNDMTTVDGGYFCNDCEKKVYDVSNYTEVELTTLKSQQSNLCINFKKVVITSLILNSALCVAAGDGFSVSQQYNKLAPVSQVNLNQPIFLEYKEEVELGGGYNPVTVFEPDGDIWVPVEPVDVPPIKKDDNNNTKNEKCKS